MSLLDFSPRIPLGTFSILLLEEGDPRDLFWPRPGSAPGGNWPKNNNTCKGPWVLHPYQVSSKSIKRFWRRSRKCEKFTDDGRRTDRRTVRYDNSSLEPSAQVSLKQRDDIKPNCCLYGHLCFASFHPPNGYFFFSDIWSGTLKFFVRHSQKWPIVWQVQRILHSTT